MKRRPLKYLLALLIIISAAGLPLANASAQFIDAINYLTGSYYPVWSLTGIGAPWWASTVYEAGQLPAGLPWPRTMILPYAVGLGGYGITGFAGIGLLRLQPPSVPPSQGFTPMTEIPPCFGLSIGLGMGGFGGLGITRFGSPDAIMTMGIPWNWQPFFGLTSITPGPFYLGMYSPWWYTMGSVTSP